MASILIVDDDVDSATVLADLLRDQGFEVRLAHDGQQGIRVLANWTPDVIVLDVWMPVLDGPGMVYRLQFLGGGVERIPIVLVSSHLNLGLVASRIGTPYFVRKPPTMSRLLPVLERALTAREAPKTSGAP